MSVDYLRDCLRSHVDKPDYPAFNPMHIPSIIVSTFFDGLSSTMISMRWEEFRNFRIQIKSLLGVVGCCQRLGGKRSELFELRFALEKAAMEHLAEDKIVPVGVSQVLSLLFKLKWF